MIRRAFSTQYKRPFRKFNQNLIPASQPIKADMQWLWHRPDPAPIPKAIQTVVSDNLILHQLVKPKPLHLVAHERVSAGLLTPEEAEKVLPPVVYGRHGQYEPRELSEQDYQLIKERYQSQPRDKKDVSLIACELQCSRQQVIDYVQRQKLAPVSARHRVRPKGVNKWHFTPKYVSARINP
jgi:hypothetical protein